MIDEYNILVYKNSNRIAKDFGSIRNALKHMEKLIAIQEENKKKYTLDIDEIINSVNPNDINNVFNKNDGTSLMKSSDYSRLKNTKM